MIAKKENIEALKKSEKGHASTYSSRYFKESVPKFELPEKSMPANAAYQLIHDELNMDANPSLNLASFVTTWMEPEAEKLMMENLHKNFIDHDEYPQTEVIHHRCVNMLARLFNSPKDCNSIGTATVGSSEAIMLGLLAHKWSWKNKRIAEKKPFDKPNIIFGAEVHVCWEKFARYFDVEMRIVPIEKDCFVIKADQVKKLIDENTIAVGAILGTTYTGQSDPIEEINTMLLEVKKETGLDIPLHVDAASGGFVTPFTNPKFLWDFRLEQVKSINVSGHKYGLVYPGIGWILWRDEKDFPKDLEFKVNYLGGWMPTYTLNFSRSSIGVLGQYYNFLRLGMEGYSNIMNNCLQNAQYLAGLLENSKYFEIINNSSMLPIVAVRLKETVKNFTVFDLSSKLRERGWVIAAYTLPQNAQEIAIMRIVVREHFSHDMAEILYKDINNACAVLNDRDIRPPPVDSQEKHRPIC
ncbi:MAG: glutamate decarboxylase [Simkaniaceae bacterium]|nr:glutamate decarboxylase [Simkaniaceae bacterium]